MTTFDYTRPRATAERLIARFGQSAAIIRNSSENIETGEPWDPVSQTGGDPVEYPCTLVLLDYTVREREASQIQTTDRRVLISTQGLDIVPNNSDSVKIGGQAYSVVSVAPLAPGGVDILYEAQVRL